VHSASVDWLGILLLVVPGPQVSKAERVPIPVLGFLAFLVSTACLARGKKERK
jgi:hypothetical protein